MLQIAVKAQLPLVAVTTRDTLNLPDVVKAITGVAPEKFNPATEFKKNRGYLQTLTDGAKLPLFELYTKLVHLESTLILTNPSRVIEPMFDAGEVLIPKGMLLQFINEVVGNMDVATALVRGLGGCTLKEAAVFARLTMARDGSLTPDGLTETRRASFHGATGLTHVDLSQGFYEAPDELASWVAKEKAFFLEGTDPRLMPRGLLYDGPPGCGKTAGAKYLAREWGIPLYRVDIGGTKNKYVGQSEANMIQNLSRLDHEEPCVALLDEVEKVFAMSNTDSSGTTSTMLSQLLWWLAERQSKVFVVMTTNNAKALPKELYREGRIDEALWFGGLAYGPAEDFVKAVLQTFGIEGFGLAQTILGATALLAGTTPPMFSHPKDGFPDITWATKNVDYVSTIIGILLEGDPLGSPDMAQTFLAEVFEKDLAGRLVAYVRKLIGPANVTIADAVFHAWLTEQFQPLKGLVAKHHAVAREMEEHVGLFTVQADILKKVYAETKQAAPEGSDEGDAEDGDD